MKFSFIPVLIFLVFIQPFNAHSNSPHDQQEAMAFLKANMSSKDLKHLPDSFLLEHIQYAFEAKDQVVWGNEIPKEIFFNYVLPYSNVDETRESWRKVFYERFIKIAKNSPNISQAVKILNKVAFKDLKVSYSPDKRPKANQSPYESIKAHYASCTGLSILLIDVLRSVGIPARLVGIPMWPDGSGNHTWVEIWDHGWKHIGASEDTPFNQAWFTPKASELKSTHVLHRIYAVSFQKTNQIFPMRWAQRNKEISAIDVTSEYLK